MMDRRQQRLQLALLPPALFIPTHQDEASRQESLEALGDTVQPFIIYQETSDIWINVRPNTTNFWCSPTFCVLLMRWVDVSASCLRPLSLQTKHFVFQVHDIFHPFIQTSDDEITFITVNESKTGFCHLYKITSVLQRGSYNWAKGYTHSEGNTMNNHRLHSSDVTDKNVLREGVINLFSK